MTETLTALAQRVAEARRAKAEADQFVRAVREEFEQANAELFAEQKALGEALAAAEAALRDAAAATYQASGEKRPAPGVEVKVYSVISYPDAKALEWAKGSGMCLTLDKKAFEKIAKATPLSFVTYGEEPRVTIASDLDAALAVAGLTNTSTATTNEPAVPAEV